MKSNAVFLNNGEIGFQNFVNTHLTSQLKKGFALGKTEILVEFIVEMDGSIKQVEILNEEELSDLKIANILARIIKNSPKWKPGSNDGELVRQKFFFPFEIDIK